MSKVDALIHLAAYGVVNGINDWEECFRVNVNESLALWRRAVNVGVKRFVICGSCFEYGQSGEHYDFIPVDAPLKPTSAYGASKAAATMAALALAIEYKLELVIARPFHVYGEGEDERRFWPSLRKAALSGADFPMTIGTQIRDFTPVETAASKLIDLAGADKILMDKPFIYNMGSGRPQTLFQFANVCWTQFEATGKLLLGVVPLRENEVMRFVPRINHS